MSSRAEFFTRFARLSAGADARRRATRTLDSPSKVYKGQIMQPTTPPRTPLSRRFGGLAKLALFGLGIASGALFFHGTGAQPPALVPSAVAANAAVTPKTEVPGEAKA